MSKLNLFLIAILLTLVFFIPNSLVFADNIYTIFPDNFIPAETAHNDSNSVEVGVKFKTNVAGYITGIRFYKGSSNTGTHIGSLWSSTGTLLSSGTFSGETASGWQILNFSQPISVSANTIYVAAYLAPVGRYADNQNYFGNNVINGPLTAPSSGTSGGNGVYRYSSTSVFPNQTYNSSNYSVDVFFTTSTPTPTVAFTPTPTPTITLTPTLTPTTTPTSTPVITPTITPTPILPTSTPTLIPSPTTSPAPTPIQTGTILNGHNVIVDSSNRILAWNIPQNGAYERIINLAWNKLINGYPSTGCNNNSLPLYYCFAVPFGTPPNNQGSMFAMFADSAILSYGFTGNTNGINLAENVLDYDLTHGRTPINSGWSWQNVPYASADQGAIIYQGANDNGCGGCGSGDGTGVIEPDKVGQLGYQYLRMYEFNGNIAYRDAAIADADALALHVRTGDVNNSPWPFRVYAQTNVIREQYTADVIEPIKLFDELIRLNLGNVSSYQQARQTAWNWMMTYPIQNNLWSSYYEDVWIQNQNTNINQWDAFETAKYLMEHPQSDSQWQTHVAGLIPWVETNFGPSVRGETPFYGANPIGEQVGDLHAMGSDTARYAAVNALYYSLTGDLTAKEKAYRALNWSTYMSDNDGNVIVGPQETTIWFTDGYGDYIRHFINAMAADPDLAPVNEDHLLGSTSTIQLVNYQPNQLSYRTYDSSATETLKISYIPQTITENGVSLFQRGDLIQEGWIYNTTTGVLKIRHDHGTDISINNGTLLSPTPTITPSPTPTVTPESVQTVSLQVSASADDASETGGTVTTNSTSINLGCTCYAGYRFQNINIPKGATILSASLGLYTPGSQWNTFQFNMYGENSANSAVFSQSAPISPRALTTASISHSDNVQTPANSWFYTDDASAMIQQIINQSGWTSGNSLSLIIVGSPNGGKAFDSYDAGASTAPKLTITYQTGVPTGTTGMINHIPLISTNVPAYSSSGTPNFSNDNSFSTYWNGANNSSLSFDLSTVPVVQRGKVVFGWFNDPNTLPYDSTWSGGPAVNLPANYTIEGNPGAGGTGSAPTSGWVVLSTTTNNTFHSRQHIVDLTGYNWVRMNVTSIAGGTTAQINVSIHDAHSAIDSFGNVDDDWLFLGASETAFGFAHTLINGTGNYSQLVYNNNPYYTPIYEEGGLGGSKASDGVNGIANWLSIFPGKYVSLSFGGNDADQCTSPSTYYSQMSSMVQAVINVHKIPVVWRVYHAQTTGANQCGQSIADQDTAIWQNFPQVIHGPDFWTYFGNNPQLIGSDNLHPTDQGYADIRTMWQQTMSTNVYQPSNPTLTPTPTNGVTPTSTPTPTVTLTPTPTTGIPTPTPTPGTQYTIFPSSSIPNVVSQNDNGSVELGIKFTAGQNGTIWGIRFYKGTLNTGTHVGNLWSSTGTLLASATFIGEGSSGWQQVNFANPVAINANTTYIASYFAPKGEYSVNLNYFGSNVINGPLTAPSSGTSGGNGVYRYSSTSVFPNQTYNSSNYWVDVIFTSP